MGDTKTLWIAIVTNLGFHSNKDAFALKQHFSNRSLSVIKLGAISRPELRAHLICLRNQNPGSIVHLPKLLLEVHGQITDGFSEIHEQMCYSLQHSCLCFKTCS